jgi:hypothetical protein
MSIRPSTESQFAGTQAQPRQRFFRRRDAQALFDLRDDGLGFVDAPMQHQPTGALRHPVAKDEHAQAEHGTQAEGEPPAELGRDPAPVEQAHRAQRSHGRSDPEAAIDYQVGMSAIAGRYQLLDSRVDRRVFTADAGAGQHAKDHEGNEVRRERRSGGRDEVKAKRDGEELLAAQAIGQPAEEQRTHDGTDQVQATCQPDLHVRQVQHRAGLQCACDRPRDGDFQAIEQPGDAERNGDERMEPPPGQPVQTRRHIGLYDAVAGPRLIVHAPTVRGTKSSRRQRGTRRPPATPLGERVSCQSWSRRLRKMPAEQPR